MQKIAATGKIILTSCALSLAVLVSHAYPIALGPGTPEPLAGVLGINLGELAVFNVFRNLRVFHFAELSQQAQHPRVRRRKDLEDLPSAFSSTGSERISSRAIIHKLNSRRIFLGSSNVTLHSKEPVPLADAIWSARRLRRSWVPSGKWIAMDFGF
jgi:hypothetical protein